MQRKQQGAKNGALWDTRYNSERTRLGVMYNLGTFLEGPGDQGPGPSRTKDYNLGCRGVCVCGGGFFSDCKPIVGPQVPVKINRRLF